MNGDSGDVHYFSDPLLCPTMSNLQDLRHDNMRAYLCLFRRLPHRYGRILFALWIVVT